MQLQNRQAWAARPARAGRRAHLLALAALALTMLAGCNIDPYRLTGGSEPGEDAGVYDATPDDDSAAPIDAALPDACVAEAEVCGDNMDNDCDGNVDEDFDFMNDPANCGGCGIACTQSHTAGTCDMGTCAYECLPGYYDMNGDLGADNGNGCEYGPCFVQNGGVEECNLADDDCDGTVDEGIDTATDVNNCGTCANQCQALNAEPLCETGLCTFGACDPGYADISAGIPGCEYACPEYPPAAEESCDGIDNDCDGTVDELPIAGLGSACTDPGYDDVGDTGTCSFGTLTCNFGVPTCEGYVGPEIEVCDDLDNDCDGVVDNGYDKQNDPRYCGGCSPCSLDNAVAGCSAGTCTVNYCTPGWTDADGDPSNGCEYACSQTGPEVCDGVDNDCDTAVDENLTPPDNFCATQGECAGTAPTCAACDGVVQWRCVYGGDAEVDACGALLVQESLCDELDGDCDGAVDEHQPLKGTACDDGDIGICQGTGTYICDAADPSQILCDITDPGQTPLATELCNDADDDCDGVVDEAAVDDMVMVSGGALIDFWIDVYEASRPGATASYAGTAEHRACSVPGVLPWRNVSWAEAEAACAAAGKRLCTEAEWQLACEGLAGNLYPYGSTYDALACNGKDYDYDCTTPDDHDQVAATGTPYGCPPPAASVCVSEFGAHDMSGNVKEWTATELATSPGTYSVRGGSYDNIDLGLTCDFDFTSFDAATIFPNLGFRCCSDSAP